MSEDEAADAPTPEDYACRIASLIESAESDESWKLVAQALKSGLETQSTTVPVFCVLAKLIMRKLFLAGESDDQVHEFLVEKLFMDEEKAAVVSLLVVASAKKASEMRGHAKSAESAAEELVRDHLVDPDLARALIRSALELFEESRPSRVMLAWLGLAIICHPVISAPLAGLTCLVLVFGLEWGWGEALLWSSVFFVAVFLLGGFAGARARRHYQFDPEGE